MTRDELLNLIFVFIATAALGVILGLAVLRTVDTRLSDVSINVPPVKVPPSNVVVNVPDEITQLLRGAYPWSSAAAYPYDYRVQNLEGGGASGGTIESNHLKQLLLQDRPVKQVAGEPAPYRSDGRPPRTVSDGIPPPCFAGEGDFQGRNYELASRQLESQQVSRVEPSMIDGSREIIHRQPMVVDDPEVSSTDSVASDDTSEEDETHFYRKGKKSKSQKRDSRRSNYYDVEESDQYYKDLSEMTGRQISKFRKIAKIDKMTVRDYVNWLSLFLAEPDDLPRVHLSNLQRLQSGQPIREKDIPRESCRPLKVKEYYDKMVRPKYYYD